MTQGQFFLHSYDEIDEKSLIEVKHPQRMSLTTAIPWNRRHDLRSEYVDCDEVDARDALTFVLIMRQPMVKCFEKWNAREVTAALIENQTALATVTAAVMEIKGSLHSLNPAAELGVSLQRRESKSQSSQHLHSNRSAETLVVSPLATKERAEETELSNQKPDLEQHS